MRTILVSLALALPVSALAEEPSVGDIVHGRELFRMECTSCHGTDGRGSAFWSKASEGKGFGKVPDFTESSFMATLADDQIAAAIHDGVSNEGTKIPGHAFGDSLSQLETWDLVVYVRQGNLRVAEFFPEAVKFTAHPFTIDDFGVKRLGENFKMHLTPAERTVVVITAYKAGATEKKSGGVRLVKWTPVELDLLRSKNRIGHLIFVDTRLPGAKDPVTVGLAFAIDGKLVAAKVKEADIKKRVEWEKNLAAFYGQGEKKPVPFKAPKGLKGGDVWAKLLTDLGARSAEAVVMFDKSERERTIFDR